MARAEWDAFDCFGANSRKLSIPIACLHASCFKVIDKNQWSKLYYKLRSVEREPPYEAFKALEDLARLCLCKSCQVHPHRQTALMDAWRPGLDLVILTHANEKEEEVDKLLSRSKKAEARVATLETSKTTLKEKVQSLKARIETKKNIYQKKKEEAKKERADFKEEIKELKIKIKSEKGKLRVTLNKYKRLLEQARIQLSDQIESHEQELTDLKAKFAQEQNQWADQLTELANSRKTEIKNATDSCSDQRADMTPSSTSSGESGSKPESSSGNADSPEYGSSKLDTSANLNGKYNRGCDETESDSEIIYTPSSYETASSSTT
ncbi:hypothetical protein ACMFMF_001387 [Clarireedia jacksonii]